MYKFLTAKKTSIIFLILSIAILSTIASIYIIGQKNKPNTPPGYENFRQKALQAGSVEEIGGNSNFNKFLERLTSLETQNKTKEEKIKLIESEWATLYIAYSETNRHELYNLLNEFKTFANKSYGYNNFSGNIQCFDPSCAEQPIPPEIVTIIENINNSSISAELKNNYIQQLKTFSYLNNTDSHLKPTNFLALADSIKIDPNLQNTGINEQIYNAIRDYVKNTYPDFYKDYIAHEK